MVDMAGTEDMVDTEVHMVEHPDLQQDRWLLSHYLDIPCKCNDDRHQYSFPPLRYNNPFISQIMTPILAVQVNIYYIQNHHWIILIETTGGSLQEDLITHIQ
jgi:hypothetical protein